MTRLSILYFLLFCLTVSATSQTSFINEFKYKSDAISPTEGIGIAGPVGYEVTDWLVEFYNQDGTIRETLLLDNKVISSLNGGTHGEVWYDVAMLDDTDAFAVVNTSTNQVMFISYGVSNYVVSASQGYASGLTSLWTDIQLTAANSIQLVGEGASYIDFVWEKPLGSTPGDINTGQVFNASVLATELESFEVSPMKAGNKVSWATNAEINNDYFMLERSIDGVHFESIQKIESNSNGTQKTTYEYLDKTSNRSATSYYRLKQVDLNGQAEWSEMIHLAGIDVAFEVHTFPNPTVNELNISLANDTKAKINIINIAGQIVETIRTAENMNYMSIDVQHLPVGQYFLNIEQDQQSYSTKFVKN